MLRCSARAGVFLTEDGARVLCAIMDNDHREVNAESLDRLGRLLGRVPPSRRVFLRHMQEVDAAVCDGNLVENEFVIMEAIRDAFSSRSTHDRGKRADSVISETTDVASVFSRVSDSRSAREMRRKTAIPCED